MLNIIDIVVAVLIVVYLLKNFGGPAKIIKALLVIVVMLVVFGVVARLLFDAPLPEQAHSSLVNSYFVKLSNVIIKSVYPAIENGAPKVDSFIKEKIIATPTPEVTMPQLAIPTKVRLKLPEISAEF